MHKPSIKFTSFLILFLLLYSCSDIDVIQPTIKFDFNNNTINGIHEFEGNGYTFKKGIDGDALNFNSENDFNNLQLSNLSLDSTEDFSLEFWIKTTTDKPTILISQKDFTNKGIIAQKNAGWALYTSGGTFGWTIGSGDRRINYERDNGEKMPINDNEWHQITMTYNKEKLEFRLYYDGHNKAIYKVNFDFINNNPLTIGAINNQFDYDNEYSIAIETGLEKLQALVDAFNSLGLEKLKNDEFIDLVVEPAELFKRKLASNPENLTIEESTLSDVMDIRKELGANPYTVFQNRELTMLKPISQIYRLSDDRVEIDENAGRNFTKKEKLYPSNFAIDELAIWEKTISPMDILNSYKKHKTTESYKLETNIENFTSGVWNIWHGGIHWSTKKDGWDSRLRIVEMIKAKKLDVVLLQETYSSGDFIAAELGYYFATTSDWDYCYQGANISVISRFPIKEIQVSDKTEFNNVAVKLSISETQEIWAMSNWYGMRQFTDVFDFHQSRFENTDSIPVLFGGDFNAVPHTDNGDSPASLKMMEAGFTDAYRSIYRNAENHPGYTHQSESRIDQLYYKGDGLVNESTEVISTWPTGFPSDHFLIVSRFKLDY